MQCLLHFEELTIDGVLSGDKRHVHFCVPPGQGGNEGGGFLAAGTRSLRYFVAGEAEPHLYCVNKLMVYIKNVTNEKRIESKKAIVFLLVLISGLAVYWVIESEKANSGPFQFYAWQFVLWREPRVNLLFGYPKGHAATAMSSMRA
jgi:hypothetical protein